jgi:hypothetical protein
MATDITIEQLTDGTLTDNEWVGTGVFDKLIDAVNQNIEGQYNKGRIKGTDYANVYLGSMQSVISQSIEFLLNKSLVAEKEETERINQQAIKAKIRDENGLDITVDTITTNNEDTTKHHWAVENAKLEKTKVGYEGELTKAKVLEGQVDGTLKREELRIKYGTEFGLTDDGQVDFDGMTFGTLPSITINPDGTISLPDGTYTAATQAAYDNYKLAMEGLVAVQTAKGYAADTHYKTYRSLQELMFALANAGIISDADKDSGTGNVYKDIITSMEKAMNQQAGVWGIDGYVDLNTNSIYEE